MIKERVSYVKKFILKQSFEAHAGLEIDSRLALAGCMRAGAGA
jgi:hypothetical protein